jgi:hypothetical protein
MTIDEYVAAAGPWLPKSEVIDMMNQRQSAWDLEKVRVIKKLSKENDKLRQRLNGYSNRAVGRDRIYKLERLARYTEFEAERFPVGSTEHAAYLKDAAFLMRLAKQLDDQRAYVQEVR